MFCKYYIKMRAFLAFTLFFICVCVGQEYKSRTDISDTEGRAVISDMVMAFVMSIIALVFLLHTRINLYYYYRKMFKVFRHGDRTPDPEELRRNPALHLDSSIFFPYGKKALTNKGKQRAYRIGQYLRDRYDNLISKVYLPEEISIQSTDYARTKMTALTALSALYPPQPVQQWHPYLNWQPIPYDTQPSSDDILLYFKNCPRYIEIKHQQYNTPEVMEQYLKSYQDLFRILSKYTQYNTTTPMDVLLLDNLFQTLENVDIPIPEWAKQIMPQIKEMTRIEYELLYKTDEQLRLSSGSLLGKIFNATNAMIEGKKEQPKLYLFSGHEINVAALLAGARVFVPHQPNYGSTVSLELWKNRMTDEYSFMVVYAAEAGGPGVILPVNGCDDGLLCDYNTFLDLTKDYVLPENEFKKQCSIVNS